MLPESQQSTQRPSYRLPWRVHSRFGQSSLEHFARFPVAQHVEHLGCIGNLASEVYGALTRTAPRQIVPDMVSIRPAAPTLTNHQVGRSSRHTLSAFPTRPTLCALSLMSSSPEGPFLVSNQRHYCHDPCPLPRL